VKLGATISGIEVVNRDMLAITDRAFDATPAWEAIAALIRDSEVELFATEGESGGERWQDLTDSTLAAKARAGQQGRGILEATLALEQSLTVEGDANSNVQFGPDWMIFGAWLPYGAYQQHGWHRAGVDVPARPPLVLTERDKVEIVKAMQRWIVTGGV
jgi:phage gpG-like protein